MSKTSTTNTAPAPPVFRRNMEQNDAMAEYGASLFLTVTPVFSDSFATIPADMRLLILRPIVEKLVSLSTIKSGVVHSVVSDSLCQALQPDMLAELDDLCSQYEPIFRVHAYAKKADLKQLPAYKVLSRILTSVRAARQAANDAALASSRARELVSLSSHRLNYFV